MAKNSLAAPFGKSADGRVWVSRYIFNRYIFARVVSVAELFIKPSTFGLFECWLPALRFAAGHSAWMRLYAIRVAIMEKPLRLSG